MKNHLKLVKGINLLEANSAKSAKNFAEIL